MSGLEIAGLALAVVPIVASAVDYQWGVYSAVDTDDRSKVKDEGLAIQYQHLHDEVAFLHLTIQDFVSDLPTLSANDKEALLALDKQLLNDGRLDLALSQRLGDAREAFFDTLNTALKCLDDLLSDRVLGLEKDGVVQASMGSCRKLECLRNHGGNPRDLRRRIKFTSSNSKRRRALDTLTEQNKILERFIRHETASDEPRGSQTIQKTDCKLPPPSSSRNQIQNMYDAISSVWDLNCDCSSPHEAMLSLSGCFAWAEDDSSIELDLFISTGDRKWQESRIRVDPAPRRDSLVRFGSRLLPLKSRKSSIPLVEGKTRIDSICAVVTKAHRSNVALDVVNWLNKEWDKTQISFFSSTPDQLNLKPYLTAQFQALEEEHEDSEMQLHPSPAILALGILLLELQIWGTIESRRISEDLTDDGSVNVNTNLLTAERVFKETDDKIFENYRRAVRACLDCNFLDEDEVNFNDEGFRSLVYANIVAPLERELYQGWKMRPGTF
ncbi:hypothetical protein BFW01_g10618 [Lasiodiplodia theobromae]|uniref:DUF7580 domain-containing protein n=1 Tax=Lasiodiplodia theobromae TaxID=45133 RepID=A0A8H7IPJ8_9PEZI|nr:hypothetical protein BFW01_g10618 [Lasiodiplodia theobromae]